MSTTKAMGFIFDQDETLVYREIIYESFFAMMAAYYGAEFDPKGSLRRSALGRDWMREVVPSMIRSLNLPVRPEEYNRWHVAYMNTAPSQDTMPGADNLICHLHGLSNVKTAIATSCRRERLQPTWQKAPELLQFFDTIVTGDEVDKGKPAPDLILEAARRLKINQRDCIYVGDNVVDGEAAQAAGMGYIDVPNYLRENGDYDGALFTIRNLHEFPLESLGLPPIPLPKY